MMVLGSNIPIKISICIHAVLLLYTSHPNSLVYYKCYSSAVFKLTADAASFNSDKESTCPAYDLRVTIIPICALVI